MAGKKKKTNKAYTAAEKLEYYKKKAARAEAKAAALGGKGNYHVRMRRQNMRGKGDYKVGPDYGARLGAVVGEGLQAVVSKAFGFGDYKVEYNSILGGMDGSSPPHMLSTLDRSHVIRHREYLGNVTTSATPGEFQVTAYDLNPGLNGTFPWLAGLAANFEQYQIKGMVVMFKSTSADALNSTNTALGSVIMATEYDSTRPVFQNQQQMANHEFATSSRQSESCLHAIECKRSQTPLDLLWVRTGAVPTGDDERLYDWGKFQLATVGGQAASVVIGELWITYEIVFYKPQLLTGLGLQLLTDHVVDDNASTTKYFGSTPETVVGSNIGCTIGGTTITFPSDVQAGTYLIHYVLYGSAAMVGAPTVTPTNCTLLQVWQNDTTTGVSNAGGISQAMLFLSFVVQIDLQGAVVTFSGGTLPASVTSMDLWITQINGNITT